MSAIGRPESFADGFPHDLSVRNPGVAVIQGWKSRVVPEKCAERPLHTFCGPCVVRRNRSFPTTSRQPRNWGDLRLGRQGGRSPVHPGRSQSSEGSRSPQRRQSACDMCSGLLYLFYGGLEPLMYRDGEQFHALTTDKLFLDEKKIRRAAEIAVDPF